MPSRQRGLANTQLQLYICKRYTVRCSCLNNAASHRQDELVDLERWLFYKLASSMAHDLEVKSLELAVDFPARRVVFS